MMSDTSAPEPRPRARASGRRVKGISGVEFARRRGVSPQQVHSEGKTGRIVRYPDGSIDETASLVLLAETAGPPGMGGHNRLRTEPLPDTAATSAADDTPPTRRRRVDLPAGQTLVQARTAVEIVKAQRTKLRLDEEEGRLIDRATVERVWFEEVRRVRDRILSLPASLAGAALSAGGDLRVAEEAIRAELETALRGLAEEPTTKGSVTMPAASTEQTYPGAE